MPQIRACLDDPETGKLADAFGAPVIINANVRDGSLRQAVMEKNIPMLLFEAGEALRFDQNAVRVGVRGILSVMRSIGMLPASARLPKTKKIKPLIAKSTTWLRAVKSGILRLNVSLGEQVGKNDRVGVIADPFGEHEETLESSAAGIVIGRLNRPLVHAGDAILHIACLEENADVETALKTYHASANQTDPLGDDGDLLI